ncbi:unnamed protein product [Chrysoparadoxa australica]
MAVVKRASTRKRKGKSKQVSFAAQALASAAVKAKVSEAAVENAPQASCGCGCVVCLLCKRQKGQGHRCGDSVMRSLTLLLNLLEELLEEQVQQKVQVHQPRQSRRGKKGRGGYRGGFSYSAPNPHAKGTGYGGAVNEGAAKAGRAKALQLEGKADADVAAVLLGVLQCLPTQGSLPAHLPEMMACIRQSPLPQLIARYLRNDALIDLARRSGLYNIIFDLVLALASCKLTVEILVNIPVGSGSGDDGGEPGSEKEEEEEEEEEDVVSAVDLLRNMNAQAKIMVHAPAAQDDSSDGDAVALALRVTEVCEQVQESMRQSKMLNRRRKGARKSRKQKEVEDIVEIGIDERYASLQKLRFEVVPLLDGVRRHQFGYHFAADAAKLQGGSGKNRMMRISQEVSSLATSLPVLPDSSIFLRVDEDRFDCMKCLITGPKDTPYDCGCFEFDIFLPFDYPNQPPKVHFLTTGGGRVRFNPNLYNNGKVCLSLLGTWSGPGWDPKGSTLLQVLISIQSLILVAEPYFNEPGYERSLGTPQGNASSAKYNSRLRAATLSCAMVDPLVTAQKGKNVFKEVIQEHFRVKRNDVLRLLRVWLEDAPTGPMVGGGPGVPGGPGGPGMFGVIDVLTAGNIDHVGFGQMLQSLTGGSSFGGLDGSRAALDRTCQMVRRLLKQL